jgi:hypothetical protein
MNILTLDNKTLNTSRISRNSSEAIFISILDNSDNATTDFMYPQLSQLESFTSTATVIAIGTQKTTVTIPLDWGILIGDSSYGFVEAIAVSQLNDRDFSAFVFNPLTSLTANFAPIEIVDIYPNYEWCCPKVKKGQYVAIPLERGENPKCIFIVKEITRNNEVIDLGDLL